MFTRSKIVDGKKYYYLVESYREGGKVRQRTLAYLGRVGNPDGALDYWEKTLVRYKGFAERANARAQAAREKMKPFDLENGKVLPKPARANKWNLRGQYWRNMEQVEKILKRAEEIKQRADKIRAAIENN